MRKQSTKYPSVLIFLQFYLHCTLGSKACNMGIWARILLSDVAYDYRSLFEVRFSTDPNSDLLALFFPISTDLFLMIEVELILVQNMIIVAFWVSFPMHQESSNLKLCRLRNDKKNPHLVKTLFQLSTMKLHFCISTFLQWKWLNWTSMSS